MRNLFWISLACDGSAFSLVAPDGEGEALVRGLRSFVLWAKVEVERLDGAVLGVAGAEADSYVDARFESVPEPGRRAESNGWVVIHPPGAPRRFLILGPEALPRELPRAEWRRLEIEAGIAWLAEGSRESFIPQMLDLDRLGALSFDKGCFPGQEVIARTRYLGRLKRRLYRVRAAAGDRPIPGEPIVLVDGRAAGTIVAVERAAADDGFDLLAVLRTESAEERLATGDGRRVVPCRAN